VRCTHTHTHTHTDTVLALLQATPLASTVATVDAKGPAGKTPVDYAKNDEVKAVFARHAKLLAAQAGTAELAP